MDLYTLLSKYGMLMASRAAYILILFSLFYLGHNIFSTAPLLIDMVSRLQGLTPSTSPSIPKFVALLLGIQQDSSLFLGVELIFLIAYYAMSLVWTSAIFLGVSSYNSGERFSFKEVLLQAIKLWTRLFATMFFVKFMAISCVVLIILIILVPKLLFSNYPLDSELVLTGLYVLSSYLCLHFLVVWILEIVVSVMEEDCYGIVAFGKKLGGLFRASWRK